MEDTPPGLVLTLRFPARPDELSQVRKQVRACAEACGGSGECVADIVMAVDEACQNVIRHAYVGDSEGDIVLEVARTGDDLVFSIFDFAPKIDPEAVKPRDLDDVRPGGLGTHFIAEAMDDVRFLDLPEGGGNLLRMVKRIR